MGNFFSSFFEWWESLTKTEQKSFSRSGKVPNNAPPNVQEVLKKLSISQRRSLINMVPPSYICVVDFDKTIYNKNSGGFPIEHKCTIDHDNVKCIKKILQIADRNNVIVIILSRTVDTELKEFIKNSNIQISSTQIIAPDIHEFNIHDNDIYWANWKKDHIKKLQESKPNPIIYYADDTKKNIDIAKTILPPIHTYYVPQSSTPCTLVLESFRYFISTNKKQRDLSIRSLTNSEIFRRNNPPVENIIHNKMTTINKMDSNIKAQIKKLNDKESSSNENTFNENKKIKKILTTHRNMEGLTNGLKLLSESRNKTQKKIQQLQKRQQRQNIGGNRTRKQRH
jgi:hypothetical protein